MPHLSVATNAKFAVFLKTYHNSCEKKASNLARSHVGYKNNESSVLYVTSPVAVKENMFTKLQVIAEVWTSKTIYLRGLSLHGWAIVRFPLYIRLVRKQFIRCCKWRLWLKYTETNCSLQLEIQATPTHFDYQIEPWTKTEMHEFLWM